METIHDPKLAFVPPWPTIPSIRRTVSARVRDPCVHRSDPHTHHPRPLVLAVHGAHVTVYVMSRLLPTPSISLAFLSCVSAPATGPRFRPSLAMMSATPV